MSDGREGCTIVKGNLQETMNGTRGQVHCPLKRNIPTRKPGICVKNSNERRDLPGGAGK